jgi:foldase protein PrsA
MNNAKKIMKNHGVSTGRKVKAAEGVVSSKNKVLLAIGIFVILVLCLGVCYINLRPRVILNVEGNGTTNKVSYKEAVYDIYTSENQYNSMASIYTQIYGSTFWEAENLDSAGRNGSQLAKKEIMDTLKQREILYMEAQKAGMTLTDDEKSQVEEDLKSFRDGLTSKQKRMDGLDEKSVRKVLEKQALADKYKEQVITDLGIDEDALKATVSKEDYRQYTLQYYTFEKTETDDDGNTVSKSDDVLKQAKKDMAALQKKAAKAEDFTTGIITDSDSDNTDDETGISYATEDLLETDTDFMSKKARKKVKAMKNDEISDVIETSDAYYVVKMVNNNDSTAYDEQCEQVVEDEKESQFETKYKNDIKVNYTAKAQSYWKSRVTIGYITYDDSADETE